MAKNKQQIKFEADVSGFKSNIKEAEKSITSLNNQLKLNQAQLKGNSSDSNLLSQRIETLKQKYEEQSKIVDNTRKSYEKAVEIFGENSTQAENLKNKLLQAETAQQNIKNAIDKTNAQLVEQTSKLITTGKKWQESGERLKDYGSKIESVGNKLSILSGLVGGIAFASLKASIDFESAFTGVTKTVDGTEKQLADLRQGILDMSTELPSSATEIAAVAESAGQLGIQTNNILDFSKAMIDLGNSTNLTSEEAASQLAKFANIMQMSQKDFDKLGSSIVDLGNNFATTEADIVNMAMRLAGAGKQVGFSEGQVLGLATALSSVGIEAEMGGSAISKAMVKMQNAVEQGGTKLDSVLKKTGMTLRDLELMSANDSMSFKQLSQSIGMTSTEVKQLITAGTNLEDFASISGMTAEQFKKAWKDDASGALTAFIQGLGNAEEKGESAITMLSEMGLTEVRLRDSLLRAANAGDLFNNAIETGTKAWNKNIALTNEADKRYATTESQMKMLKNEVTKVAIEFGDELAPSLRKIVRDAKPMLKSITSAVKTFADLDDKTKKNIITVGAYVVALGPVTKIGGNIIKTIGSVKTGIGTLTGAIGVLKKGTDGASKSSINLANTIRSLANPFTIAAASTTLAHSVLSKLTEETSEYAKNCKQSAEETLKEKQAIDELRASIDSGLQTDLTNIERTQTLWEELQKITDENGKIKDGYEDRAKVVTEELSNALGTEITITNNVVNKYKELQNEIDKLILKKKSEAILAASQEKYNEAITNREQKTQELIDKENEYNNTLNNRNSVYDSLTSSEKKYYEAMKEGRMATLSKKELDSIDKAKITNLRELDSSVNSLKNKVSDLRGIVNDYTKDIENYEYNVALASEGTAESIQKMVNNVGRTYEKNGETVKTSYQEQIHAQQYYLEQAKASQKEAIANNDETEKKKTESTIKGCNARLEAIFQELTSQTSLIGENSEDVVNGWRELATNSYDIYAEKVKELPFLTRMKVQEITGVVVDGTPEFVSVMETLSNRGVNALDKDTEFRSKAIKSLNGYLSGLTDEEKRKLIKEAGIEDVEQVMKGLKEGDLSEEKGLNILKGLYKGLENKKFQNDLIGSASSLAGRLSSMLSIKPSITASIAGISSIKATIPGHKDGLDYVPYDNYVARLHKGERVLTAEENKAYMSDNIGNKVSSKNITVQFFPQTMSETELKRAETYIAKKWGMAL